MYGRIHSIETFGTVDGPGIRYVIFMQGCPMRCAYCHNPDSWDASAGTNMSIDELVEDISKYTRYIEGITVTGGEPLLQMDFLIELFSRVKDLGLTTCIDTSGIIFSENPIILEKLDNLMDLCDIVMLDIKHIDNDKHITLTGQENTNILKFAKYLDCKNVDVWLRYVLVPTINDDEQTLLEWKQFANTLRRVKKIEVLPYHKMGISKYEQLGLEYPLKDIDAPTVETIKLAKKILKLDNEGEN